MKVVVVIPTYNERDNLGPLLEALQEQFTGMSHDMHVLVVDDHSPDGTAQVAEEAQRSWGNVHLLTGKKRGLGVAYARGIRHALDGLAADAVVQMDADFSHDPADVPRLVAALDGGADLAIGSRYVKGGHASVEWGPVRRGISWSANLGARFIAGLYRVHDCTNGFRAMRAAVLRDVDLGGALPRGYAILTYLLYQAVSSGARVREVPVTFSKRAEGESKLRLRDALEFFANTWWIRYDRRDRFYRLAAGGVSGIAANVAAIVVLRGLAGLPAIAASVLATEVSVGYSFGWRQFWSLATGRPAASPALWRFVRFQLASAPSSLLSVGTFAVAWGLLGMHYLAAQVVAIIPALVWNYFVGERLLSSVWTGFASRIWNLRT